MAVVELIYDVKAPAWVTGNINVPKLGEPIYLTNGKRAIGDGVTQVQNLTFYGGVTPTLQQVLAAGKITGGNDIQVTDGNFIFFDGALQNLGIGRNALSTAKGLEIYNGGSLISLLNTGQLGVYTTGVSSSTVAIFDASKNLISSAITPTELGYLTGLASNAQAQLDALVSGLSWKQAVRVRTTANVVLSGTQTIDGVVLAVGERVLVMNQTAGAENGIYIVSGGTWTRSLDANTGSELVQATVAVSEGTLYQDLQYVCTTNAPITIGTTALTFVLVGGSTYVGTTNRITVVGNTIDIGTDVVTLAGAQALTNKTGNISQWTNDSVYITPTSTNTLTNKRRTRRVIVTTQSATPAINTDVTDVSSITGLAQAITSFTSGLTGTPVDGDLLEIRITDNGTARAITWGASFESSGTVTLPTTTVASTLLRIGFEWNTVTTKWSCIAVA